jgi:TctA family transporter
LAVVLLLFIARWVALLTFIRGGLLIPFVLVLCVLGTYLSKGHWENLVLLVMLSIVGYGLLRFNWPRAPFVIGLVLGRIAEESLHQALALWGLKFFLRPLSLVLIGLIVLTLVFAIYRGRKSEEPQHVSY